MKYRPHMEGSDQAARISLKVAGSLRAVRPLAGSSLRMRLIMMTSSRSVYQPLGQSTFLVDVGDAGKYKNEAKAIMTVRRPSSKNSQNHPGFPPMPRISRIPAASRAEMTRATLSVDQKAARRMESSFDL